MDQMVVIGHSQGGLLAKQTVVRTEDKLWMTIPWKATTVWSNLKAPT